MSTGAEYSRAFTLWREAAGDAWRQYTTHAFVEGLRIGTLPRQKFLHYLVQDYVFIIHYARAWALAAVKADTLDDMKTAAATVHAMVNDEMQLHMTICAAEGITREQLTGAREEAENMAYTRYVLEAGYSGDFLDLMAALAPCVLGYGEIGLRTKVAAESDTYALWIDTYAGDDYQDVCRKVGALIDAALERRLGPKYATLPHWSHLCGRFEAATRLEVGFWDMGMRGA